jgi:ABC-2 type transport system permease protein
MAELRAAWAIALRDLRTVLRYRLWIPSMIFNLLYQGVIPAFLFGAAFAVGGRQLGLAASLGTDDLAGFLFMGGVVSSIVAMAFWVMAFSLRTEMDTGTLEASWLTPTRRETLVLGRGIWGLMLVGLIQAALFAIGIAFFGLEVRPEAALAAPAIALSLVGAAGVGYLVAAAVIVMKEANFFVDTTQFLFSMLSGVAFPISVLPAFAQAVAVLLPTTWAVEILRYHSLGARPVADLGAEYVALAVTSAAFLPLGVGTFRRADRWLRVHGTVGQY